MCDATVLLERNIVMLKSHVKFNSKTGKRLILIVDDEQVNRELLGFITGDDFDALYAGDGAEAMRIMKENADYLSLVLLDLKMPVMDGFEVMKTMKTTEKLSDIPIIVLTSDEGAEVECLRLGASDFIIKPFNVPEVIRARMMKTIELFEDRHIIQSTERDVMTDLFNKEFFFRYAEQFERYHPEMEMDAISLDINHFHLINELYGRQAGDEVLIHLADYLKELREETNCIASRIEADKFYVYAQSGLMDYEKVSEEINSHFEDFKDIFVRVRSGIYLNVDKEIDIERRFDRAVQASNTIKENYSRPIAFYDAAIHERKIFEDRLLNEIEDAMTNGQFFVNFQPKFNVEGDEPFLASAEALVRWKHPQLGMISPGVFIPLLEKNGLIQQLDFHIWEQIMEIRGKWKKEKGIELPVSVNVSRMDLYSSNLIDHLNVILAKNGLEKGKLYLEITESAYTEDAEQIVAVVNDLRDEGFKIEMDDFGTGYSSLNMLADIPVDVLKLDMRFVQNLNSNDKQEKLIRLVMDIARYLGMQVVAEGVEEKEQVDFLKSVGCQLIQGYYFSKPLPEDEFVKYIEDLSEKQAE